MPRSTTVGGAAAAAAAATVKHIFPRSRAQTSFALGTLGVAVNTRLLCGGIWIPGDIDVDDLSIFVTAVGTAGTLDLAIFSEDGQTRHINLTSGTISAAGIVTFSVASVSLPAGSYYFVVVPNGTADITLRTQAVGFGSATAGHESLAGFITVGAGAMPATFDPNDIGDADSDSVFIIRLDQD